jgi:hypothetical protein
MKGLNRQTVKPGIASAKKNDPGIRINELFR